MCSINIKFSYKFYIASPSLLLSLFLILKTQYCPLFPVQCSSELCEPKYMRNTRQHNTHIHVNIYAHMRIQYTRVRLISMYELIYCFVFC